MQVLVNGYMKDANYKTIAEIAEFVDIANNEVGFNNKGESVYRLEVCPTFYRDVESVEHMLNPRKTDSYHNAGFFLSVVINDGVTESQEDKMKELGIHPNTNEYESVYFDIKNSSGHGGTRLIRSIDTVVNICGRMGLSYFIVRPF